MTPAQALSILPIFTAFANGSPVEYFSPIDKRWVELPNLSFIPETYAYRIKPTPVLVPKTITVYSRQYLFDYGSSDFPNYRILTASANDLEKEIENQESFVKWIEEPTFKDVTIMVEKDSGQ